MSIGEKWTKIRIKYLATKKDSLFMDGDWIESPYIVNEGIRYLTTGNVGEINFKKQGNGYISQKTFEELNCLKVLPNDLLISRLNEPYGRACILPDNEEPFYIVAVDIVVLRPDDEYNKRFLLYAMNSPNHTQEVGLMAKGTTMHRISRTALGNIEMFLHSPSKSLLPIFLMTNVPRLKLLSKTKKK